jgi:hypothetical protein
MRKYLDKFFRARYNDYGYRTSYIIKGDNLWETCGKYDLRLKKRDLIKWAKNTKTPQ